MPSIPTHPSGATRAPRPRRRPGRTPRTSARWKPFLLACLLVVGLSPCLSAAAWDLPEEVRVMDTKPLKSWAKHGALSQSGQHSVQRYRLIGPDGLDQGVSCVVAVWPKPGSDRFCFKVFPPDAEPDALPQDCGRGVADYVVNMSVRSALKESDPAR